MIMDAELWQVDKGRQARLDAGLEKRGETTVSERIGWLVGAGVLRIPTVEVVEVPDTRSQAIADAPRCEHGKIDKHYDLPEDQWLDEGIWCEGAPELRALLDALIREGECGCKAEHLGPDGYGCKLNRTGVAAAEATSDGLSTTDDLWRKGLI